MTKTNLVPVGRIIGTFGIHGELKCDPSTAGRTLFYPAAGFVTGTGDHIEVVAVREHKGRLLLRFRGIESATDAERFAGVTLHAERERVLETLESHEYLDEDVIGCAVESIQGKPIGIVADVKHYPSSDMLIVNGRMIPLVQAFIKSLDIAAKRIVVDLPEGLLD